MIDTHLEGNGLQTERFEYSRHAGQAAISVPQGTLLPPSNNEGQSTYYVSAATT